MNNLTKYLLNLIKKVQFFSKFSARFARPSSFLLFFYPIALTWNYRNFVHIYFYKLLTKLTYINAFLPCF